MGRPNWGLSLTDRIPVLIGFKFPTLIRYLHTRQYSFTSIKLNFCWDFTRSRVLSFWLSIVRERSLYLLRKPQLGSFENLANQKGLIQLPHCPTISKFVVGGHIPCLKPQPSRFLALLAHQSESSSHKLKLKKLHAIVKSFPLGKERINSRILFG